MNVFYYIFFIIYGFLAIIAQIVILRELITLFYGNEFFSGIVLGIWLLGTGLGSFFGNKLLKFITKKKQAFLLLLTLGMFFPLSLVFLRIFVGQLLATGEIVGLGKSLLITFLTLLPFCFLLGSLFAIVTKIWAEKSRKKPYLLVSRAYFLETLGLVIGGLVFNFFLVESTFPFPIKINTQFLSYRFPNLIEATNSKYGQIAVTKLNNQYSFFESGSLIGSTHQVEQAEYFTHTILSFHPSSQKVLLIGGGFNGVIKEILKYPQIQQIDYIELDPKLLQIAQKYLIDDLKESLRDKKVFLHFVDGRKFLKESKQKYDVVIFNLPNPSTALINRFYTKEVFENVKKILEDKGIFAFSLFAPVDYLSEEAKNLISLINQTLKSTFSHIKIFPEETEVLFIASKNPKFFEAPNLLLEKKFEEKDIKTNFFSADYLYYRLTSEKIRQINNLINQSLSNEINTDFHPLGFYYQNNFWQTMFSFRLARIFKQFATINFKIILIISFLVVYLLSIKTKNRQSLFLTTANASFTLMSFEILVIFLFQSTHGLLYSKIALIFSTILAFLAVGNLWATKQSQWNRVERKLKISQFLIVLYCLLFLLLLKKCPLQITFYILAGLIGFLTGTIFPFTNKLLSKSNKIKEKTGFLYAADLLGATFGSLISTIFLIPVFGIIKTVYFLIMINVGAILLQKPGQ